jgi:glyoxylase-like metal-dependent hydrolase (beta-lactamase superfamily II)
VSGSYAVYALKYAERDARSHEHFFGGDPHDVPMPMDYFIWVATSPERTIVIDTGFTPEVGARRGRRHLRAPAEALRAVGVDAAAVELVILSHFHYDHVGSVDQFPGAQFVVQDAEMAFWTGRVLSRPEFRKHVELADLQALVRLNYDGRMRFADGDDEVASGISVHCVGGHTGGLQVVRIQTNVGPVVLAADASHYYANIEQDRPFSVVTDLPGMYRAFDTLRSLAGGLERLIPGHDPLVLRRFPAAAPDLDGIAARIA